MVLGSMTSQRMLTVISSKNGSRTAVPHRAARIMSDSLMPFQPEMEEPSNILPSRKKSVVDETRGNGHVLLFAAGIREAQDPRT
jgi:hypothetical protein